MILISSYILILFLRTVFIKKSVGNNIGPTLSLEKECEYDKIIAVS